MSPTTKDNEILTSIPENATATTGRPVRQVLNRDLACRTQHRVPNLWHWKFPSR